MTNNGGKGVVCPDTAQDRPRAPQKTQYAAIPLRIDSQTGFGPTRAICGLALSLERVSKSECVEIL